MVNFNTNQARYFYVAGAINANVNKDRNAADSAAASNLDIALKQTATGELYFSYKNADGKITRSDSFVPAKVVSVKKTVDADMATPLLAHTVAVDTNAVTLANLVGKVLTLNITVKELFDYDQANNVTIPVQVIGDATNTANAAAFHKALAMAIAKAQGNKGYFKVFSNGTEVLPNTPASGVTGAAAGVVLVQAPQKWVRGKLENKPVDFSCAFDYSPSNVEQIVWGTDTVAKSAISGNTEIAAAYALADLEYFAQGEKGDEYRGNNWPNNFEPTYVINPASGTKYNVLTVEYFWSGEAENVQKSPRLIQVCAPATESNDIVTTLYNTLTGIVSKVDALDDRVAALEKKA